MQHLAFHHAVLLELERGELELRLLPRAYEADVLVRHPDLGHQLVALGHERHQDRAGRGHGARGMRREVLDDAGLRRAQLEQLAPVRLLGELLARLLKLRRALDALGLQLAPVVGGDLRHLLLRLLDQRLARADHRLLRAQVLLLLDALALLVGVHDAPGEAVLAELLEGLLLLHVMRQHLLELRLGVARGLEVVLRLLEQAFFLCQRVFIRAHVGGVLRIHLGIQIERIAALALQPLARELRVDAPQRDALVVVLGLDRLHVGIGQHRVHAHQHLALAHRLALLHQDLLDDALLGGLHDLEIARRHELAVGDGDDVELAERGPQDHTREERDQQAQHPAGERRGRLLLDAKKRRGEIGGVGAHTFSSSTTRICALLSPPRRMTSSTCSPFGTRCAMNSIVTLPFS